MQVSIIAAALLAGLTQAYEITLYSKEGWSGKEVTFETGGHHEVGFNVHSWEYISPPGDGCCVRFCYKGEPVGYRCSADSNYRSSSPIDEVATGCGSDLLDC
ncbi:hypothetical protein VUR80DRAFT_193 [Thermomyces stellatus]